MTLEERMNSSRETRIENYFGRHDDMVRELRDAVTVTAQLEARQARGLKDHTQWLWGIHAPQQVAPHLFSTLHPGSSTAFALATDTFTLNATGSPELVRTCWTTGFPRPV